jgi:Outer membrane receptor for ferrienterochelin and colicins
MKKNKSVFWVFFSVLMFFPGGNVQAHSLSVVESSQKAVDSKLQGFITDMDGQPLDGAFVYIPELNKSCVAGKDGGFHISNLPLRTLYVQYSFLGYANQLRREAPGDGKTFLNIRMEASPIETEEIVVSGVQYSTQHENAVKIDVLNFDNPGMNDTPNFTEKLCRVPGVDMISKGSGVSKPVIRGLSMNDILVLNNGVRFENYQYSSHHPLGINEYGTEKVEIIKGPASLLYGSDAMGGVLNFIKEKPALPGRLEGDYQLQLFSNSLGENSSLGLKGATENFFGGFRLGQKSHADYLQGGGDYLPNSRFKENSVKANAGYTAPLGHFCLFYDYNEQLLGLVEEEALESLSERGRKNELFYQKLNTHLLSSQNSLYLGETRLDLNTAFQSTDLTHIGEPGEYELQMQLSTLTYEAKWHLTSNKVSDYIFGVQGLHQKNENRNQREIILLPNALVDNFSAFGLVQQSLGKLQVQTGLRYDFKILCSESVGNPSEVETYRKELDKEYGSFSGSAGLTYNPAEEIYFRGNIATAYRTPNLAELTSNGPHEAIYEKGDETLKPEKSVEMDLSTHWHRTHFAVDLAGFYNRIKDYIFQSPTGLKTSGGMSIYQYRQNDSRLYGGEAGFHVHPACLPWMHLESTFAWVTGKQKNGDYLPFIPARKLNLDLRGEKDRVAWFCSAFAEVHVHFVFDQDCPAPEETATDGYSLYDLGLGGTVYACKQPLMLRMSINNLLNTKYVDHLSTLKEVGAFNPGRNLILTLKIPFLL